MVLLTRSNCVWCRAVRASYTHLITKIMEVVQHPDGMMYIKTGPYEFVPLPANIVGLPALIHDNHVYIGESPIMGFLHALSTKEQDK